MFKKRIVAICVLILTTTLIFQVKSYTMAKVSNSANVAITNTENALIAITKNSGLNVEKNTKILTTRIITDEAEEVKENTVTYLNIINFNLQIQNNMNYTVDLTVSLDRKYEGISLENNKTTIGAGNSYDIFEIRLKDNMTSLPKELGILIEADWRGGSAIISDKINVELKEKEPEIMPFETIDLRTEPECVIPPNESNGESSDKEDINKDITNKKSDKEDIKDEDSSEFNSNITDNNGDFLIQQEQPKEPEKNTQDVINEESVNNIKERNSPDEVASEKDETSSNDTNE